MPPATTRSDGVRLSRPEQVAETLKDWIVRQQMAPGDRLPGEQVLIDRFGMAKGTIREAMRILEAQGLIKTRTGPGGGSFVHEVSEVRARGLLGNYFYFKNLSVSDIYDLRIALEPQMAADLAGRLTEAQLTALEAHIDRYDAPPVDAEDERRQHVASLEFHQLLASHADNPLMGFVIGFMANMLSDLTVYRRLYEPRNYDLWRQGRDSQRALVAALRAGAAETARQIMADHMLAARAHMERQEARMERRFLTSR